MRWRESEGGVIIENWTEFDAKLTFECGQAFRWEGEGDRWVGTVQNRLVKLERIEGKTWFLHPCSAGEFEGYWRRYFDMDMDYANLIEQMKDDLVTCQVIRRMQGLRVLRQERFETLITFIISANNHFNRIKKITASLCREYGTPIPDSGGIVAAYAFPTSTQLAQASPDAIREKCGAGYRSAYIVGAARMVEEGFPLAQLDELPYDEALKLLQQLPGVGVKVANCILLFACGHRGAFPVDTWIKKVLTQVYGVPDRPKDLQRAAARFGPEAGYIQQMLFCYYRMHPEALENPNS
ncbi:DNA-3-methyladenine glycosylase 2 family protein [Christensenellaceae bacterium NSJ-44]|uniref:DNA-(apurinic or apyrimidinic site) lyase n=1 Tax=Luoshenia tenuis TaxID=2763654 RepID=A0A926D2B5_9FIRM|nr:DNA glycosylase [Luoshenia tenuis]MBC8530184.1 DNA-3-methyladenine glycosylase 2 family protein [Luoshenia tenuis]